MKAVKEARTSGAENRRPADDLCALRFRVGSLALLRPVQLPWTARTARRWGTGRPFATLLDLGAESSRRHWPLTWENLSW